MTPKNKQCPRCESTKARYTDCVETFPRSELETPTNVQSEFTCLRCGMVWWEWDKVPDYMLENKQ